MKDRGEDKDMVGRGEEACANDLTLSITKFTVFTLTGYSSTKKKIKNQLYVGWKNAFKEHSHDNSCLYEHFPFCIYNKCTQM